ncbi:hypothetical protein QC763_102085 [Podospora pseudopauciseta]|uniref:Uncharacterized protein n=1 Tax=Podospora pseudopauciseta TaxID=2093780 RepID=A0ABR0HW43_9PEZI|nr:hypothetical protein QC763_102085 [Podospora pseudopauciseta]
MGVGGVDYRRIAFAPGGITFDSPCSQGTLWPNRDQNGSPMTLGLLSMVGGLRRFAGKLLAAPHPHTHTPLYPSIINGSQHFIFHGDFETMPTLLLLLLHPEIGFLFDPVRWPTLGFVEFLVQRVVDAAGEV